LEESAKAEFEEILAERDAIAQLNELDRLVGEARARRDAAAAAGGNGNGEKERVPYGFAPFLLELAFS
jgi:kinetochore protein NNF1